MSTKTTLRRNELRLGTPGTSEGCRAEVARTRKRAQDNPMQTSYFHVYILRSEARLAHHNSGGDPHTAKYRPWRIKTAIAFTAREQALAFERYLKSASGRAFAQKRL